MVDFYPNEKHTSFKDYWNKRKFPRFVDIESTNRCDARCKCCLQDTLKRVRGCMTFDSLVNIAHILKKHNVTIRGFYTTGNPLMDPTLFEKMGYARKIGIAAPFVSLNTTTSLLTPDLYDKVLQNSDNITLSFFNVGKKFEELTGNLSWKECYQNAIDFINYREYHRPNYRIFIGCNTIEGADLAKVKDAFKNYRVEYAVDAELRWAGKFVTGVIDRAIMYPQFRCDGHEGVLQIKWNGDIEVCSYDFKSETHYANILKDDWNTIVSRFKDGWKKGFSLCKKCDYFHLYWSCKKLGYTLPPNWFEWQLPFLKEGEKPQR